MNPASDRATRDAAAGDDKLRQETHDGIRQYDRRPPTWWLFTLYGVIAFAAGYWACNEWWKFFPDQIDAINAETVRIEGARLATASSLSDDVLWRMSANSLFIEAGRTTFLANCAQCHRADLAGGIGPNLTDGTWIHGARPLDIYATVSKGVTSKGMPAWEPVLGSRNTIEVTAFVLSHHKPHPAMRTETSAR